MSTGGILSNSERATLLDAHNKLTEIEARKAALNEEAKAVKATVKAVNVLLSDFNYARKIFMAEDEVRAARRASHLRAFEAFDLGHQPGLFDNVDGSVVGTSTPEPQQGDSVVAFNAPPKRGPGRPRKDASPAIAAVPTATPTASPQPLAPEQDGTIATGLIFSEGSTARSEGTAIDSCPYEDPAKRDLWVKGWSKMDESMAFADSHLARQEDLA